MAMTKKYEANDFHKSNISFIFTLQYMPHVCGCLRNPEEDIWIRQGFLEGQKWQHREICINYSTYNYISLLLNWTAESHLVIV